MRKNKKTLIILTVGTFLLLVLLNGYLFANSSAQSNSDRARTMTSNSFKELQMGQYTELARTIESTCSQGFTLKLRDCEAQESRLYVTSADVVQIKEVISTSLKNLGWQSGHTEVTKEYFIDNNSSNIIPTSAQAFRNQNDNETGKSTRANLSVYISKTRPTEVREYFQNTRFMINDESTKQKIAAAKDSTYIIVTVANSYKGSF